MLRKSRELGSDLSSRSTDYDFSPQPLPDADRLLHPLPCIPAVAQRRGYMDQVYQEKRRRRRVKRICQIC